VMVARSDRAKEDTHARRPLVAVPTMRELPKQPVLDDLYDQNYRTFVLQYREYARAMINVHRIVPETVYRCVELGLRGSVEDILRSHSFQFGEDPNDFVDDHEEAYGLGLDVLMWSQEERLSYRLWRLMLTRVNKRCGPHTQLPALEAKMKADLLSAWNVDVGPEEYNNNLGALAAAWRQTLLKNGATDLYSASASPSMQKRAKKLIISALPVWFQEALTPTVAFEQAKTVKAVFTLLQNKSQLYSGL